MFPLPALLGLWELVKTATVASAGRFKGVRSAGDLETKDTNIHIRAQIPTTMEPHICCDPILWLTFTSRKRQHLDTQKPAKCNTIQLNRFRLWKFEC